MSAYFFWILVGCALVTFIPRILPFILVRQVELPKPFLKWLTYIPVCILTALVMDELLLESEFGTIEINVTALLASIPTIVVAFWTKSLSFTVITGVVTMALLRLFI
ncbi:AzlD domain-containing protein [Alkalicoccobacillus plakortidis]|uniref:AzlD domain-containing protein n=1 Tax=Alkalicoccobacillus plakortidis TaxID=444060 RepID=A0ABT0XE49_9BACI|nr:AzlD domain-containing protein [Alkalicoccobacillus plakortidis]MCM2674167.1 AzlD domain-containing protein [Alkalicoccobacillus plakortidis]